MTDLDVTVDVDTVAVNTIRTLVIDAVAQAKSGHPGAAIAMAPVGYTLWNHALRYDTADPTWINRDRFVLSAGHASMLLYALLHLAGVRRTDRDGLAVQLDDIRRFRQLGSPCAGHPEHGLTDGVECTTGPLGTGVATSVGMAMAGKWQAAHFNRPGFDIFDYRVYALAGDGDMMEGIAQEAASLAGHLKLDNLCWIYDSNAITIEGETSLSFTEDVAARFRSYGWTVTSVPDANDIAALRRAFDHFHEHSGSPMLIVVSSIIGYGAPTKQGTAAAHSEPLGGEEARAAKRFYRWPDDSDFLVPEIAYEQFRLGVAARGHRQRAHWDTLLLSYQATHPELARELTDMLARTPSEGWDSNLPTFVPGDGPLAGRSANHLVLNEVAAAVPWLIGGAADLAPSTKTALDGVRGHFGPADYNGRNLHFGVREAAAAAAANGLALCGLRPFQAGFLVFSDFQRGPLRLGALMRQPVIHIYTHDSIGMGEDGPTHQPIEQLASLRAIPDLIDLRPADANEVREAWRVIMSVVDRPVALVLSKQDLPVLDRSRFAPACGLARGAYVLADPPGGGRPDVLIIGTGSEVALALDARNILAGKGIGTRVVSMPSWALFDEQGQDYRDSVLPPDLILRIAVEAASGFGWERHVGPSGRIIAMRSFGASGPGHDVRSHYGFTAEEIVSAASELVGRTRHHG
ncbi:transketolase [Mycolicibacterium brisbanense]|uniref:Transketolase n=1 Tax=Mycolicibacterium brisbanense TaxID=146020 RepID=A0A100VTX4_9MYCO|nr:transketolase [Mycolicibacterium brisbanense]MCV7160486.1 transketolase [Mycolicibacterium brisbanense]GAS85915.1 transketolase [Mycolicibacterium brisbanense]